MTNPIIQTDLAEVLGQINTKLDRLSTEVTDVKVGIARIEGNLTRIEAKFTGDIQRLDSEISTIKDDIKEIRGSQRAQIWTLIGILITAVAGFLTAVGRSVFSLS